MPSNPVSAVRYRLKENADEKTRRSAQRFFKETVKHYGVKSAVTGRIARECFKDIAGKTNAEILMLCEELWRSGYMEESFVACEWSYYLRKNWDPGDFKVLEHWVQRYVNNWASCDTLCNHTVGSFIEAYPAYLAELKRWARSDNRWMRRAAMVSLIVPARNGKFLKEIFELADSVLTDIDDMVQKGYGWMLKAASQAHQREVFEYVMRNKRRMPRTALRYAIEKMPDGLKKQAMAKD